ncbi:glutaredoxin family protein [Ornithinibacillus gellani]|uniref:glutaredoxin family protein n=1 Tax=Ornithinibacillus gellani TaxID=2293253 RepID=UPI000F46685F|nr:glutaredoxin family protein [Ornithinibacillus gellani]TQS76426.1 glutaredoxin family protein [Ornithinibacillus gellani]
MSVKEAVIFISNNCEKCDDLLEQLDAWNISYETKNVTDNREYMKELQDQGVYGTPATFVKNGSRVILGLQFNRIKQALGVNGASF